MCLHKSANNMGFLGFRIFQCVWQHVKHRLFEILLSNAATNLVSSLPCYTYSIEIVVFLNKALSPQEKQLAGFVATSFHFFCFMDVGRFRCSRDFVLHTMQLVLSRKRTELLSLSSLQRFSGCYLRTVYRRSHSRPHQVPFLKRERMLQRPSDTFLRPTGVSGSDTHQFLAAPTGGHYSERNSQFSRWRHELKNSKSPDDLISRLEKAIGQKEVDSSVFGAAIQKCGHCRWWRTLLDVHREQVNQEITFSSLETRICLSAMASCLKDGSLTPQTRLERKKVGLILGRELWYSMSPSDYDAEDFNMALGSVWSLCAAIGEDALPWAIDILRWSSSQPFQKKVMAYTPLLSLYEKSGLHQEVDELLTQMLSENQMPNEVTLGDLVNATGHDWKRADQLWKTMVERFQITPNVICFVAHAKVHMLAGRPLASLEILDKMWAANTGKESANAAVVYLQALLIVCHSNPSEANLSHLSSFLTESDATLSQGKAVTVSLQAQWRKLSVLGRQLLLAPLLVKFEDLLVYGNAKDGEMRRWKDLLAGSKYLSEASEPTSIQKRKRSGMEVFEGSKWTCSLFLLGFPSVHEPLAAVTCRFLTSETYLIQSILDLGT